MSERIQILNHKGKKILFMDCRDMKPDDIAAMFPEVTRICIENRINLSLSDITNTTINDAQKNAAMKFAKEVKASLGTLHVALVGIKGIQRIIAQAVVKDNYFAKTKDEALDYLVSKG